MSCRSLSLLKTGLGWDGAGGRGLALSAPYTGVEMESEAMETRWNYTSKPQFTLSCDHGLPLSQAMMLFERFLSLQVGLN